MIGGGETQFRPSQSVVWEEGDYGLLALSMRLYAKGPWLTDVNFASYFWVANERAPAAY